MKAGLCAARVRGAARLDDRPRGPDRRGGRRASAPVLSGRGPGDAGRGRRRSRSSTSASQMVIELTSLAGVMAREYAARAGESDAVAQALFDMERPRSAGDAPPATLPGAVLALADRFDMLVGLFAVGAAPTGSSDPFGLRRAAAGVISILRAHPTLRAITLARGLPRRRSTCGRRASRCPASTLAEVAEFVDRRFEQQLLDAGHDHRHVAAVRRRWPPGDRGRDAGGDRAPGRRRGLRRAGGRAAAGAPDRAGGHRGRLRPGAAGGAGGARAAPGSW